MGGYNPLAQMVMDTGGGAGLPAYTPSAPPVAGAGAQRRLDDMVKAAQARPTASPALVPLSLGMALPEGLGVEDPTPVPAAAPAPLEDMGGTPSGAFNPPPAPMRPGSTLESVLPSLKEEATLDTSLETLSDNALRSLLTAENDREDKAKRRGITTGLTQAGATFGDAVGGGWGGFLKALATAPQSYMQGVNKSYLEESQLADQDRDSKAKGLALINDAASQAAKQAYAQARIAGVEEKRALDIAKFTWKQQVDQMTLGLRERGLGLQAARVSIASQRAANSNPYEMAHRALMGMDTDIARRYRDPNESQAVRDSILAQQAIRIGSMEKQRSLIPDDTGFGGAEFNQFLPPPGGSSTSADPDEDPDDTIVEW